MGLRQEVKSLGRFFSGKSKAFDDELKRTIKQETPSQIQLVDTRPEFFKRREQRQRMIQQQAEDQDQMVFVRMVQKQNLNQPLK